MRSCRCSMWRRVLPSKVAVTFIIIDMQPVLKAMKSIWPTSSTSSLSSPSEQPPCFNPFLRFSSSSSRSTARPVPVCQQNKCRQQHRHHRLDSTLPPANAFRSSQTHATWMPSAMSSGKSCIGVSLRLSMMMMRNVCGQSCPCRGAPWSTGTDAVRAANVVDMLLVTCSGPVARVTPRSSPCAPPAR